MKTSNKLLLGAVTFCYVIGIITLSYAKSKMEYTVGKDLVGNGVVTSKIMTNELKSHKLILDGFRTFILDPHSTQVVIEAEENILPILEMKDDDEFEIDNNTADNVDYNNVLPIKITIGIKGKDQLVIEVEDNVTLIATDEVNLKVLKIESQDRANVDLNLNATALNIDNSDRASMKLEGECNAVNYVSEDNSKSNFDALTIKALNLTMQDNSALSCKGAEVLSGSLEDNARAYFKEEWKAGATINIDNAITKVGESTWD